MKKIQYSVYKRETNDASGKAKKDAYYILREEGYEDLYKPSEIKYIRVLQQYISLKKIKRSKEKGMLIIQYPSMHKKMYGVIRSAIHKFISAALIHDISSIQGDCGDYITLDEEISFLNNFDYLIVPNSRMLDFLVKNGCRAKIIDMKIYDYLHDINKDIMKEGYSQSICFAGNLNKSEFVTKLGKIRRYNFVIYGKGGEILPKHNAIAYAGILSSDNLVYKMRGDYGLVWDGAKITGCEGERGEYMRYNSPHKLSSYIAAGKPVIAWRQAAIADFITENNIGILVDSLLELNDMDLSMNYELYKKNVVSVKTKIGKGYYLKNAIRQILKYQGDRYE